MVMMLAGRLESFPVLVVLSRLAGSRSMLRYGAGAARRHGADVFDS